MNPSTGEAMADDPPDHREVEYREKWAYMRTAEKIRYRTVRWYLTIVATLPGLASGPTGEAVPKEARPAS